MIKLRVVRDFRDNLIVLDIIADYKDTNTIKEFLLNFECMEDAIELKYQVSKEIKEIEVYWFEEWDYEHTECDSYLKEK